MNYEIRADNGRIIVDNLPLIFYHYQGLKIFTAWLYDPGLTEYGRMPLSLRRLIYNPYIDVCAETLRWARHQGVMPDPGYSKINSRTYGWRRLAKGILQRQITVHFPS